MTEKATLTAHLLHGILHPLWPVLVLLVFVVTAFVLRQGLDQQEHEQVSASLTAELETLSRELQQDFNAHRTALRRMAERRQAQPDMSEALWRQDAEEYLEDFGTYQAIEWIDTDNIIRWLEPVDGNASVIGFNVAFNEEREQALREAAENGHADVSGVLELQQGGTGLVIYEPIGRGRDFLGFIAGVFHMEKLIQPLNTPRVRNRFQLDILEQGEPAFTVQASGEIAPDYGQQMALNLPTLDWQLRISPTRNWVEQRMGFWSEITFVTLLMMGVLIAVTVLLVQLVLKRNRALLSTRKDLDEEIAQRQAIQSDLNRLETTDTLTGLANRHFFMDDLSHTLGLADRQMRQVALIMMDLDRFQMLNDSLGHQFGDELLIRVSQRLNELNDERVLVAYAGGDEFMICQQQVENIDDVINLLGQIQQIFEAPFEVQNEHQSITATLGVALYPQSGLDADTLLRNADVALYRAKERGRNTYQFYTDGMQDREVLRLELDKDLSQALARDEFVLYFQPQLDLATMQMGSAEALIRWQHPERGLLSPIDFIPLAEESGRIREIGRWVITAACRQLAQWQHGPLAQLRVAINLSGRELEDEGLVENVRQTLDQYGIAPERLEVELTEEIFIDNLERNLDQLTRLSQLGVHLAVDDFGVGYSSLGYLRDFPVDLLKIDRSFIHKVTERHDDAVITRAVINLAHNLGIQVAAEGVETEAQLNFLRNHRCDLVQGYLISRPVPPGELEALFKAGLVFEGVASEP